MNTLLIKRQVFHINQKRNIKAKAHDSIDPGFMSMYLHSMCAPEFTTKCISSLYIPPIEEQHKIIRILKDSSNYTDITSVLAPSLNLLVHQRYSEFENLINALIEYETIVDKVKTIIDGASVISVGGVEDI